MIKSLFRSQPGRLLITATILLVTFFILREEPLQASVQGDFDQNRARLLTYVMRRQVDHHFSKKSINDELSKAAFGLHLKQLDYQKRFLLADEVEQLSIFESRIDDEVQSGRIVLAPLSARLLENSIRRAEKIVKEILEKPFDFSIDESYETDPEKLDFPKDNKELYERWRQELKYRTLTRYLNLIEDAEFDDPAKVPEEKQVELEKEAREKVLKRNLDYFERLLKETIQDHYDRYLNAFARAFDPHTTYMAPKSKEDFDISMRGSLEGIGATLREEDGYIKVVKVIPGSAADRQGQLHADDVILAVAQGDEEEVDVTDMRLRDAVSLIRGDKGTEVRLTIKRSGHKNFVIPIVRDVVIIEESFVKSAHVVDPDSGQRFGYIKIPSFYRDFEKTRNGGNGRNSTDDVKKALVELQKKQVSGVILDLRNNGGGALTDAVGVTGLFIEEGPVVQVRSSSGDSKVLKDQDAEIVYDGPLVVLVNQFSASASEIVAGALQDYGRAVIVGSEHTHGKGTVQVVMDLDRSLTLKNMQQYMPLGALKVTTQKFYRISGDSTQYRGVVPDVILPDRRKYNEFGERYLDYSLPWDAIPAAAHEDWTDMDVDMAWLNKLSRQRVAEDEKFIEIERKAEILGERINDTMQSIQLEQVYAEWNEFQDQESPHGMMGGEPEEDDDDDAKEGEEEDELTRLIKSVESDPYALEAMAILNDLRQHIPSLAGSSPASTVN